MKPNCWWKSAQGIALPVLAVSFLLPQAFAQTRAPLPSEEIEKSSAASAPDAVAAAPAPAPPEAVSHRYRLEFGSFDNNVSNQFGHWWGSGLNLSYQQSERLTASGQIIWQRRPGETERLFGVGTLIHWSRWFYTDLALSGGGPNDSAAFFPRVRYDWTANFKVPGAPGLILNAGLTKLYFGDPIRGRVVRTGAVYYWRRFVFQGTLYLNSSQPGNHASKSVNGAAQYGQEGRYWMGLIAGGGREAWQTLALTPQDVEFSSYSTSVFLRKWLSPSYGVSAAYGYSVKRTAYRIHGLDFKFFWDF